MIRPARRSGFSLVEMLTALVLAGVLLGLGAPPVRRALAWARVRSARDLVASQLARARSVAVMRGGADLVLDVRRGRAWIEAVDTSTPASAVADAEGVRISADGLAGDTVRIGYDGMGIGRLASRTLRFRAGAVEARMTISSYGRVRTW